MLTWYRETYEATATDEAASVISHLWTPDGANHDPGATGKLSKREDWSVHYLQVYVTKTTTGYLKPGVILQLILGLDNPGAWMPLVVPERGVQSMQYGTIYRGRPFRATHGVGWAVYKGALVDTDKVVMRILYEPIREAVRGPR